MVNPVLAEMLGAESSVELLKWNLETGHFAAGYSRQDFKREIEAKGEIRGREAAWKRSDGTTLWVRENTRGVRDATGKIVYYEGAVEDISARKLAEDALREGRAKLDAALASMTDGVFITDTDGHFIQTNDAFASFFRCRDKDQCPKTCTELRAVAELSFVNGEVASLEQRPVTRALRGEAASNAEYLLRRNDTGESWVGSFSFGPIRDENGTVIGSVVAARDITESNRAEEALRRSEETNRATFEQAAVGITHIGLDGGWLRVNDKFCDIVGYTREELLRMKRQDITHPDDAGGDLDITRKLLSREIQTHSWEKRYLRKDQTIIWVNVSVSLVRTASGEPEHFISVVEDISERKRAEDAVRSSEEKFAMAFHSSPILMAITTPEEGRITELNDAFRQVLGYEREECIGHTTIELGIWADPEDRRRIVQRIREKGFARNIEVCLRGKSGEIRSVALSMEPITIDNAECFLSVAADITARKQAEAEKSKLQEQLVQSQRLEAIGLLAGGIAHDFNNLLMVIMANTELLTTDADGAPGQRAEKIMKSARRAAELTRQLLAFSRKQTIQPMMTSMNQLVNGVSDLLERLLGENIEVRLALCEKPWPVKVDRAQFEQVIMNLVVNARDAMSEGGRLTLETSNVEIGEELIAKHSFVRPGKYAMLSVTDTGTGMSPEVQARLFEPFFTTKEVGRGTGLGLSMVYGIVKQADGFIFVDSEVGRGACFRIYLPQVAASEAAKLWESISLPTSVKKKATILVVEDDDSLRDIASQFLQLDGHKVIVAGDLDEACRVALEHRLEIDLLLTDVVLKGGNAKQLVHRLNEVGCAFRVVYMSGYTPDAIVHHGVLDPGILFLQKPFSKSALLDKVQEAFAQMGT